MGKYIALTSLPVFLDGRTIALIVLCIATVACVVAISETYFTRPKPVTKLKRKTTRSTTRKTVKPKARTRPQPPQPRVSAHVFPEPGEYIRF